LTRRLTLSMRNFGPNSYKRESSSTACLGPDVVDQITGEGIGGRKLTILTNTFARKLLFHPIQRTKVIGVEYSANGTISFALVTKEVIVSAGTFNSPALLLRSGIGNCTELKSIGIRCRVNSPYVGRNFADQIFVTLTMRMPASQTPILLPYFAEQNTLGRFFEGSLKSAVASQYTNSSVSNETQPDTKISWAFGVGGDPMVGVLYNYSQQLPIGTTAISIFTAAIMRPKCVGKVSLADPNPASTPVIGANYACPDDFPWARQVMKDMLNIATNLTGIDQYQILFPTASMVNDPTTLDAIIRGNTYSAAHPTGTNRMGDFDDVQQGVVSGKLCVHGVQGLRVADASILPTSSSLNPQGMVYTIGAKAARYIKEGLCN